MKEILNEWRKFLNEYEDFGEDYGINSMKPVSYEEANDWITDPQHKKLKAAIPYAKPSEGMEFYKIEMTDGEEYIADYDPTREPPLFVFNKEDQDMGEEFAEEALRYLNQDAPYDQERLPELPEPEENDLEERCQKGYKTHPTRKTKKMYGKTYRNCVKAEE